MKMDGKIFNAVSIFEKGVAELIGLILIIVSGDLFSLTRYSQKNQVF